MIGYKQKVDTRPDTDSDTGVDTNKTRKRTSHEILDADSYCIRIPNQLSPYLHILPAFRGIKNSSLAAKVLIHFSIQFDLVTFKSIQVPDPVQTRELGIMTVC